MPGRGGARRPGCCHLCRSCYHGRWRYLVRRVGGGVTGPFPMERCQVTRPEPQVPNSYSNRIPIHRRQMVNQADWLRSTRMPDHHEFRNHWRTHFGRGIRSRSGNPRDCSLEQTLRKDPPAETKWCCASNAVRWVRASRGVALTRSDWNWQEGIQDQTLSGLRMSCPRDENL